MRFLRRLLEYILALLSRAVLKRYRPVVVAVTGSVGKTMTKEAIFAVLRAQYYNRVRETSFDLDTEIGVPLTILGLQPAGRNPLRWAWQLLLGIRVLFWCPAYPEVLVLEMGADRPGDIHYLARLAPPHIAVVTSIGEIPVHVEFFAGPKNLAREKARLIEALPIDGWAVLSFDDVTVREMRERSEARILTFGLTEGADVHAVAYEVRVRQEGDFEVPDGISFKIEYQDRIVPVRLTGVFGRGAVAAALAAAAVGLALKMNLVEISEALTQFISPPGRLTLVEGMKKSFLIDDTYNAAPQAMEEALTTLGELPAKRRIAVLGDMRELGKYSEAAHRSAGERAARTADVLVTVGERMRFAAQQATARGLHAPDVHVLSTTGDASRLLREIIRPGDLVLVKGARAMHMEEIVEALRGA